MNFATATEIADVWRPLSSQERANAEMLLTAAAKWIRDRTTGLADDDPAAKYVSIDVVKSALVAGPFVGHSSYSKGIGPWTKAGTLINPAGALEFTDFHREMLGLNSSPMPVGSFGDCE